MTPMMQQYHEIKRQHPDAILFFRLGDFYEMFGEDAIIASRDLEITLTARDGGKGQKVPMCGVPHHSAESYIARLLEKGHRVAICEQVEDPAQAKGIVRREVVRKITPGTVTDQNLLEEKGNNFLVALHNWEDQWGVAAVDVSTGAFYVTQMAGKTLPAPLAEEIMRLKPKEIIAPEESWVEGLRSALTFLWTPGGQGLDLPRAFSVLHEQLGEKATVDSGVGRFSGGVLAAAAALDYLRLTQKVALRHIREIHTYFPQQFMVLDASTRRNLELTETLREKKRKGSLLGVLDRTVTAMGGRLLKQWIEQPLVQPGPIKERLDAVEELTDSVFLREELRELLDEVYDLERLMGRVVYGNANGRDLVALKNSLAILPDLVEKMGELRSLRLVHIRENLDPVEDLVSLISAALVDDPPFSVRDGGIIRTGFHAEVDELRQSTGSGKEWIAQLEARERERTGIKSLKVGFNKVFGYYIEVTNANLSAVPLDYIRKQTLANAERFITPELKEYENRILGAEDRVVQLEYQLFTEVREKAAEQVERIQKTARLLAELDALLSFAQVAVDNDYVKPQILDQPVLTVVEGRHPVVEETLGRGAFVPNDIHLDAEGENLLIVTGPNMAGKSTYMRQIALTVLMAQAGSFVPAQEARIGIVDRIFTRVGASDDLATGQSTFMVEMNECLLTIHHATPKSLVIMDEVGRGTSTSDGMAIAQAIIEHLHNKVGCRTVFSTHYHELAELGERLPRAKNVHTAVKEQGKDLVFLRKVLDGKANKSYGIHCARLAGFPNSLIERAFEILAHHEGNERPIPPAREEPALQLSLFAPAPDPLLDEIAALDINALTPLQALNLLADWKKRLKERGHG